MSKNNKLNVAVIGATGYTGLDLTFLLSNHSKVKILYLCASKNVGKKISFFDKRIKKKLPKISLISSIDWNKLDIVFLSLPNGGAQKIVKKTFFKYNHLKYIDLSADFRLKDPNIYFKTYKNHHKAKNLIKYAIYSISELSRKELHKFRIVANPGCYPTSIQLALFPLLKKNLIHKDDITIDAKSGYSGAGKNFKNKFSHKNLFSSTYAYGIKSHRHMSEIDQEFSKIKGKKINFSFNPHLIPTFRGMLSCIYIKLNKNISGIQIRNELFNFYKKSKFIKVLKLNSELGSGNVLNTNNCEISVSETDIKNKLVIFSAIDNLVKGAAGQAIQNMNLLFKFSENFGLK